MSGIYIDLDQIFILIPSLRLGSAYSLVTQRLFERAEKESGATESGCTKRQTAGLGKGWAGEGKGALVVGHQARCLISRGWQADGALGVEPLACDMVMAVNPDLFAFSVIQVI